MTLKTTALGVGLMLVATASWAGDADVCYSQAKGRMDSNRLTDTTKLDCGHAGTHTLPELAKDGWSIVSVAQDLDMGSRGLVGGGVSWMVIIQKK